MEIKLRDDKKLCEIWLTNAEKNDETTRKSLEPIYKANKARDRVTVVYESGAGELYDSVLGLLAYNKKRTAQTEVEIEKRKRTQVSR